MGGQFKNSRQREAPQTVHDDYLWNVQFYFLVTWLIYLQGGRNSAPALTPRAAHEKWSLPPQTKCSSTPINVAYICAFWDKRKEWISSGSAWKGPRVLDFLREPFLSMFSFLFVPTFIDLSRSRSAGVRTRDSPPGCPGSSADTEERHGGQRLLMGQARRGISLHQSSWTSVLLTPWAR